ncbi:The BTB (BR-C, ttk and bab)/POZ (Pox virus and Zinc finger) domain [Rhizoctonia solani]|uniref:The BTB (BR-C, ttk and bab)/POZ (Pox virus and Zinc finger) domain n=1 Tax=Rhizoctonia solani TaxID=456999 RepID=A0A8H8NWE7_9AGAM|nr:The BTB (BR-C, ttk and bab)/POZ (Pox virus and Zinc finger) domain [Rhizoctonia solani]QRW21346.1 The BTB (BR-C, ttk and bab)/POZ (Pox virus and Zinc finger) domain [Rhizoctonia solani]
MSSNPANILIARSSPSAIFPRSSSSPPWLLEEAEVEDIDEVDVSDENADTEPIDVDVTFRRDASYVGTVKIIVETTTFWAHKDILMFASPFFEAVLSGNWAETSASKNRTSCSSIITISQPPSQPSPAHPSQTAPATSTMPHPSDEIDSDCVRVTDVDTELSSADESDGELAENKEKERLESLKKLQGASESGTGRARSKTAPELSRTSKRRSKPIPDAVIQLKEEKAGIFHDFLKFVYPHLECTVAWNNVEGLMNISHKLVVPSLQTACLQFLLTHAAGKPIKAMRIAELFEHEELYRESSRFVLDNPGGWSEAELSTLSQETLLKLEKRRNWFLERVLKLGLVPIAREYQCSLTCPDPSNCARQLEEKWRLGYHALFRFGPAQPSMVFRYLRQLEGVSPPLSLTTSLVKLLPSMGRYV